MKKGIALLLALVMCLSLCACGGGTPKSAAGTYKTAPIFDTTYIFNENSSYDVVCETRPDYSEKGTYVYKDGELHTTNTDNGSEDFFMKEGYLCRTGALSCFEEDEEYGLGLTLDDNGRTDQTFESSLTFLSKTYHAFNIEFKDDGTCIVYYHIIKNQGMGDRILSEKFEGTYSVDGDIMTVSYNGSEHIMIIDDGVLYFHVLEKVG